MSEVKVNKISPRTACGTVTMGDSGDTITIPAGVTLTNSGTAAGFGSTGEVSWNTTKITADPSTAATGVGYFTDTSGSAFNVTLPASPSAGNVVAVADYANTWDTNNLTIARNGSNIEGAAADFVCNTEGSTVTLVYVDATKGWVVTNSGNSNQAFQNPFVSATGGNATVTCGDFKTHIFTGPGTFSVSTAGTPGGPNAVEYLVVAGGGGAGAGQGGGGGAGGFRSFTALPGTNSPANAPAALTLACTGGYPITVGGGGAGRLRTSAPATDFNGSASTFSTITSAGGGGGGTYNPAESGRNGGPGGSGGGGGGAHLGNGDAGVGNTPPTSPAQGTNGSNTPGSSGGPHMGGGGGGAVDAATNAAGGDGSFIQTGFVGPTAPSYGVTGPAGRYFSGGGGGRPETGPVGEGGLGGGGDAQPTPATGPSTGATNTGGGGGAVDCGACTPGGTGGSGIVIIRYKFQ